MIVYFSAVPKTHTIHHINAEYQSYNTVQIMLMFSQKIAMKIVSEIKNKFFELLFFEHAYLIY